MRSILPVSLCVLALTATAAFAGPEDALIVDDRVPLEQPFVHDAGSSRLSPTLVAEIHRIGRILVAYGAREQVTEEARLSAFVEQYVLDPSIEYRAVTELPGNLICKGRGLPLSRLSPGARERVIACTEHRLRTWVREDLLSQLSLRKQALLLLAERLRFWSSPVELGYRFQGLLELPLELLNQQSAGLRPRLTKEQVEGIEDLRQALADSGLNPEPRLLKRFFVTSRGGGLVSVAGFPSSIGPQTDEDVPQDVYVGIGATFDGTLHRKLSFTWIGTDISTGAYDLSIRDVEIVNSSFGARFVNFGQGARIVNSNIRGDVFVGKNASLLNVFSGQGWMLSLDQGAAATGVTLESRPVEQRASLFMKWNTRAENLTLARRGDPRVQPVIIFSEGSEVRNLQAILEGEQGMWKTGPVSGAPRTIVIDGVTLDFANLTVCMKGENLFYLITGKKYRIGSVADLEALCIR